MGEYLTGRMKAKDSIVRTAYEKGVPIFIPAFSDCSAGMGFLRHQWENPDVHASIDSAKDFVELTKLKLEAAHETGLVILAFVVFQVINVVFFLFTVFVRGYGALPGLFFIAIQVALQAFLVGSYETLTVRRLRSHP